MYVAIRRVAPDVRARGSELHVATIDFSVDAVQKQSLPTIRAGRQPIRDKERVRVLFLPRRRQGIQSPPQLMDPSTAGPARELAVNIGRIDAARQEQPGLEQWLVRNDLGYFLEFHRGKLPFPVFYRDVSSCGRPGQDRFTLRFRTSGRSSCRTASNARRILRVAWDVAGAPPAGARRRLVSARPAPLRMPPGCGRRG